MQGGVWLSHRALVQSDLVSREASAYIPSQRDATLERESYSYLHLVSPAALYSGENAITVR